MNMVLSIIEVIATVVAALGAIIAVIVTIKIAKKQDKLIEKQNDIATVQNDLTDEQNKISAAQADIARQQNKIALLETRTVAYEKLLLFYSYWQNFSEESIESLKKIPSINSFQTYISLRELTKLDTDYIRSLSWFDFQRKHSDFFIQDMACICCILRLFSIPNEHKSVLVSTMKKYKEFSDAVHSMKFPTYSTQELESIGKEINNHIQSQEWMDLIKYLEKQIAFNEL